MIPAKDISDCIRGGGKVHSPTGYLRKSRFNKVWYAHRLAYSDANGGIPEGYHIHHLCDNKVCINPEHLVALSPGEHREVHTKIKAAEYYIKLEHCPHGHKLDGISKKQRFCITCKNKRNMNWRINNPNYFKEYKRSYKGKVGL